MVTTRTEPPVGRVVDEELVGRDDDSDGDGDEVVEVRRRVSRFAVVEGDDGACEAAGEMVRRRRVSRFAVEGAGGVGVGGGQDAAYMIGGGGSIRSSKRQEDIAGVQDRRRGGGCDGGGSKTLPPPHAWLAVEETAKKSNGSDTEEQWARLLRGSGGAGAGAEASAKQPRRSSFSVVRRERAAREAWLDRAWEMKKSWHKRNGGAPDADTPVMVVVGKGGAAAAGGGRPSSPSYSSSSSSSSSSSAHAAAGVAMDMEEVRACRDLGLELPSDCTVEIQCYGLSAGSSPTHSHAASGTSSPSTPGSCSISSPGTGEDPVDVKARLKVWAQAVALASTTHLGS